MENRDFDFADDSITEIEIENRDDKCLISYKNIEFVGETREEQKRRKSEIKRQLCDETLETRKLCSKTKKTEGRKSQVLLRENTSSIELETREDEPLVDGSACDNAERVVGSKRTKNTPNPEDSAAASNESSTRRENSADGRFAGRNPSKNQSKRGAVSCYRALDAVDGDLGIELLNLTSYTTLCSDRQWRANIFNWRTCRASKFPVLTFRRILLAWNPYVQNSVVSRSTANTHLRYHRFQFSRSRAIETECARQSIL
jgi:hypothetical protein